MGLADQWKEMKEKLEADKAEREAAVEATISPEDKVTAADNFRNSIIGTLGMPEDWKNTVADEKRLAGRPQPIEANGGFLSTAMSGPGQGAKVLKMGPALLESAAMKAYPEFAQYAAQMARNAKAPVVFKGPVPSSFQKLRDFLGHTGPVILKGK